MKLPQSLDAEMAVLGALLLDCACFYDLPSGFRADDFYRRQHRPAFAAIAELVGAGKPADTLTVVEHLRGRGELEDAGGSAYLAGLPDQVPSTANVGHYAKIVQDLALRRELMLAHAQAAASAGDESIDVREAQLRGEHALAGVVDRRAVYRTARDAAKKFYQDLETRMEGTQSARGFATGLREVDAHVWIHPTDLVLVAGRPGDGKSVFLWQIAREVAKTKPVMFVSLEMAEEELTARAVMDLGSVTIESVRKPRSQDDETRLSHGGNELSKLHLQFVPEDDPLLILREATRRARKGQLALLAIDYLQIVSLPREWGENRDQRIGELTRRLKRFATTYGVPVLAAAQVKRIDHLARGRDPRPGLEDLRESGNLEQDANVVLFLYRPGVVEGTKEHKCGDLRTTHLLVGKQRSGRAPLTIELVAEFEHARFREPARDPQQQLYQENVA